MHHAFGAITRSVQSGMIGMRGVLVVTCRTELSWRQVEGFKMAGDGMDDRKAVAEWWRDWKWYGSS